MSDLPPEPWRKLPRTWKQERRLKEWGVLEKEMPETRGECSNLIHKIFLKRPESNDYCPYCRGRANADGYFIKKCYCDELKEDEEYLDRAYDY